MSDGPYKSLPMRPAWKKVARRVENVNFDRNQVVEQWSQAVTSDFQSDIPSKAFNLIRSVFESCEGQLFPDQRFLDLSNARRLLNGSPLGFILLDCSSQALAEGKTGLEGLIDAVSAVVEDRGQRAAREIEELYFRNPKSSGQLSIAVRDRLKDAIDHVPAEDIARQILGVESRRASQSARYQGIDDGVPLI